MGYEDDLEENKVEEKPKNMKKKKSKNKKQQDVPDQVVVLSICEHFNNYFSEVQVRDTLIANNNDVDKSNLSLK